MNGARSEKASTSSSSTSGLNRIREVVWEPPSPYQLMEKVRKGWNLVALEWERDRDPGESASIGRSQDVPYGLRVAAGCITLEENPDERQVLTAMLNLIVKDDVSFSQVARELNEKGFRTRDGFKWTQTAVFEMLSRMVEVAPTIFSIEEWEALKQRSNIPESRILALQPGCKSCLQQTGK